MKKILIVILAITSVFCLTGCNKKAENQEIELRRAWYPNMDYMYVLGPH